MIQFELCESCGKKVYWSFGPDMDCTLITTLEPGKTGRGRYYPIMNQTEVDHVLCLPCYRNRRRTKDISTILT